MSDTLQRNPENFTLLRNPEDFTLLRSSDGDNICCCNSICIPVNTTCIKVVVAGIVTCVACQQYFDSVPGHGEYMPTSFAPNGTFILTGSVDPVTGSGFFSGSFKALIVDTPYAESQAFGPCVFEDDPFSMPRYLCVNIEVGCNGNNGIQVFISSNTLFSPPLGAEAGAQYFDSWFAGIPWSDGVVVPNRLGVKITDWAVCPGLDTQAGFGIGGTATVSLVKECNAPLQNNCVPDPSGPIKPCPECVDLGKGFPPGSVCEDSYPPTLTLDLTGMSLCDYTGCPATCTLGLVLLSYVSGSCEDNNVEYFGVILDGSGHQCVEARITWDGGSWFLVVSDVRCGNGSPMWGGYLGAGATGPAGTFTQVCFYPCVELDGSVCTLDVSVTGECNAGCPGTCDPEIMPDNTGADSSALHVSLGGIAHCDGSGVTGLGYAHLARFGSGDDICSGSGEYAGENSDVADGIGADIQANITRIDDTLGFILTISDAEGLLWMGCCPTPAGIYTRLCDTALGGAGPLCCDPNCAILFVTVTVSP